MRTRLCTSRNNVLVLIFIICISLILTFNLSGKVSGETIIHVVKPGDSIYKIAINYGITVDEIMKENNLHSSLIFPGQKVVIPLPSNEKKDYINYTVQPGDSLYLISRKYAVSISELREINNLDSNLIFVEQKLKIPVENDEDGNESYRTVRGDISINNNTRNTEMIGQVDMVPNKVFPPIDNSTSPGYEESEIIIKYRPTVNSQSLEKLQEENSLRTVSSFSSDDGRVVKYRMPDNSNLNEVLEKYKKKEEVLWAEPNYIYYPTAVPQDRYYGQYQWNMVSINQEAAWDVTRGNREITVAVLDTGIIPEHPDLKDNIIDGVDFVGGANSYPVESYRASDYDPTDETSYQEGGSHGTHVAGIIGAVANNDRGVAGINWKVNILPIRAMTRKGGTSWDIVEGIYYAIDHDVDIINMSFGSTSKSILQKEAIQAAVDKGITIIAATGNDGNSGVYYPAAFPETIAVGAVGRDNIRTDYSNYGPEVDLVAPGGNYGESILSTWGYYQDGITSSDYNGMIGTSMAAPHVSGVAALLKASGVVKPEEIKKRLISTTRDLGVQGEDNYYGYGLVDAYGALLNSKLDTVKVLAVNMNGSQFYRKSETVEITRNDSFELNKIEEGTDYIIAWLDTNNNQIIDAGDYYGQVDYHSDLQNVNLPLSYLGKSGELPAVRVVR